MVYEHWIDAVNSVCSNFYTTKLTLIKTITNLIFKVIQSILLPTVELVSCPDLTPTGQSGPARIESLLAFVNSKVQNELGTLKIYVCVQMANWPFFFLAARLLT